MSSLKDIARRAGVSIGTVDRVLHGRGRVSESTRLRVERISRELSYRPNLYARNLSLGRSCRLAVLMPRLTQDSEYWKLPARGIQRARRELLAYKVEVRLFFFDRYAERSCAGAFRRALAWKPDGLLIAPVLPEGARQLIYRVPSDVPYVFFDSGLPGFSPLSAIGQDPYASGRLAARLMKIATGGRGKFLLVRVAPADYHIDERLRGFAEAMEGIEGMHLLEIDSRSGEKHFREALRGAVDGEVGGIFVSNAWTHAVVRQACRATAAHRLCIIGYDLVERNRTLLEEGAIDFLISQRPEMQGYQGISLLYRHLVLREKVPRQVVAPLDILTSDNVRFYLD